MNKEKPKVKMKCDCCKDQFNFKDLTFIKKKRKGQSYQIEIPNPNRYNKEQPEYDIIYVDILFVCPKCRLKQLFKSWCNGKAPYLKLTLVN